MIKINKLKEAIETDEMMGRFMMSAEYVEQMCWQHFDCALCDIDKLRAHLPDAPKVPDLRLREAMFPGCSAGIIFRRGQFTRLHWVMIESVELEGFYRGNLAYPLFLNGEFLWLDQVLFAPRHICAATTVAQMVIGQDDHMPPPSGQAAKRTGLWNPCAGCSLDLSLCKECDAIDHLRDLAAGRVSLPDVKSNLGIEAAWRKSIIQKQERRT